MRLNSKVDWLFKVLFPWLLPIWRPRHQEVCCRGWLHTSVGGTYRLEEVHVFQSKHTRHCKCLVNTTNIPCTIQIFFEEFYLSLFPQSLTNCVSLGNSYTCMFSVLYFWLNFAWCDELSFNLICKCFDNYDPIFSFRFLHSRNCTENWILTLRRPLMLI